MLILYLNLRQPLLAWMCDQDNRKAPGGQADRPPEGRSPLKPASSPDPVQTRARPGAPESDVEDHPPPLSPFEQGRKGRKKFSCSTPQHLPWWRAARGRHRHLHRQQQQCCNSGWSSFLPNQGGATSHKTAPWLLERTNKGHQQRLELINQRTVRKESSQIQSAWSPPPLSSDASRCPATGATRQLIRLERPNVPSVPTRKQQKSAK